MIEKLKRNWLIIVVGIAIISFFIVTNDVIIKDDDAKLSPVLATSVEDEQDQGEQKEYMPEVNSSTVMVDVKGEVQKPGVYEVEVDARTDDVIQLAGGFSSEANEMAVNLAQKVQDEMAIIVPKIGEVAEDLVSTQQIESDKVRVNTATQEEIETLPGIGPAKAQAIIQYREETGQFKSAEDLLEISGIGEKTLGNIIDNIQIP